MNFLVSLACFIGLVVLGYFALSLVVGVYGGVFRYRKNLFGVSRMRYVIDVGFSNLWTWFGDLLGCILIRMMLKFLAWKCTRQEIYTSQYEFSPSEIDEFLDAKSVFKIILPFSSIFEFIE